MESLATNNNEKRTYMIAEVGLARSDGNCRGSMA